MEEKKTDEERVSATNHTRDGSRRETNCKKRLTRQIVRGIKWLEGLKTNLLLFRLRPRERASGLGPYGDDGVRDADESAVADSEEAQWVVTIPGRSVHLSLALPQNPCFPNCAQKAQEILAYIETNGLDAEKNACGLQIATIAGCPGQCDRSEIGNPHRQPEACPDTTRIGR